MSGFLKFIGISLIILSFIGGTVYIASIDWDDYDMAKISSKYTANELDSLSTNLKLAVIRTEIIAAIAGSVSGILLGLIFMWAGQILEYMEEIKALMKNESAPPANQLTY